MAMDYLNDSVLFFSFILRYKYRKFTIDIPGGQKIANFDVIFWKIIGSQIKIRKSIR